MEKDYGMQVVDSVKELLEQIANAGGYFIVDVTFKCEGGRNVLRILADKKGGITADECARLNQQLGDLLDNEKVINEEYILEVSSPGLDRRLESDGDFIWAMDRKIRLTTYVPIDGQNVFEGKLLGLGEGTIVVEKDGISSQIPKEKIASAKLAPTIDWKK